MNVAVHQPNFMPWLGIFHKAAMADTFVVFDHVQAMGGSSWMTRNRILVRGEPRWLTMPVERSGAGLPAVNEVRVLWDSRLVTKQLRTLEEEYGRHPHFDEVFGLVRKLYEERPPLLARLNEAFFRRVLNGLGLDVKLVSSSELSARDPRLAKLRGNDLLVAICEALGAEAYISGAGCLDYIDPAAFEAQGIAFWFQRYVHPEYPQRRTQSFVSHLSVLDALFNVGFDGVRELVEFEARERVSGRVRA